MDTDSGQLTAPDVRELFRSHYLGLVRLAARLVDDLETAEDVVQEAFAGLVRRAMRPDDPVRYLQSAVLSRSRSVLRRRAVARAFSRRSQVSTAAEAADASTLVGSERQQMLQAIARLPRRQREAVVLRYYEDLPVARIAEVLDVSPGAVSSALDRALSALAPIMEHRNAD